jgi:hypothetical protein
MKFKISLDATEIRDAIDEADGADELKLVIEGTVNKNGKTDIINKYLIGELVEEYVKSF